MRHRNTIYVTPYASSSSISLTPSVEEPYGVCMQNRCSVYVQCSHSLHLLPVIQHLDRIICLFCVHICHYIFPFYYLDIFFFFLTYKDRKHYYIKVVESIQFVCAGNSRISRVLCNANTYRSIHEGLFFNSSPALYLKYPLRLPYIHFYFSSLHLQYKYKGIHS